MLGVPEGWGTSAHRVGRRVIEANVRPPLKVRHWPVDAAIMENSAQFLFQLPEAAHVREVVARRYWTDYVTGRKYVVVSVTEGRGDPQQPGIKHWVVRGYPKRAAR